MTPSNGGRRSKGGASSSRGPRKLTEAEKVLAALALQTALDMRSQDLRGDAMPSEAVWAQFPNLVVVDLSHCLGATAGMLARLARGCPGLEQLSLFGAHDVTPKGVHAVLLGCTALVRLRLRGTGVLLPEP